MIGEAINDAGIAFKTALIEASLNAEPSHHLGYAPGPDKPEQTTNYRNCRTAKTGRAVSSRCCCRNTRVDSPPSTTASWRCLRAV